MKLPLQIRYAVVAFVNFAVTATRTLIRNSYATSVPCYFTCCYFSIAPERAVLLLCCCSAKRCLMLTLNVLVVEWCWGQCWGGGGCVGVDMVACDNGVFGMALCACILFLCLSACSLLLSNNIPKQSSGSAVLLQPTFYRLRLR